MLGPFEVAEQDRRGGGQADQMRIAHDLEPEVGGQLVRTDLVAHVVGQDFRRGAGKRAQPLVAQARQVVARRHPQRRCTLPDFERRERVDVQVGAGVFHRAQDRDVGLAGIGRVDAALQAHLGRALGHRFARTLGDFLEVEIVGFVAKARLAAGLGKGAERAGVRADVGVVDVAIDDVGHLVAHRRCAQAVRRLDDRLRIRAARGEERGDVRLVQLVAVCRAAEDLPQFEPRRAFVSEAERPIRAAGHRLRHARAPLAVAGKALAVGKAQDGGTHRRVEPAVVVARHEARVDREPRGQRQARLGADALQPLDLGPGGFGIDVIERDGADPAPVVDPRLDDLRKALVVEVGRHLYRYLGRQDQARGGNHAQEVGLASLGRGGHLRARLGAEVLDDDFLDVPVRGVHVADREQRFDSLARSLADADQHAGCHRHARAARRFERGDAQGRHLVGRAVMRLPLFQQPLRGRFEHQSGRRRDRAQRTVVAFVQQAGVDVRQQARLSKNGLGAGADVIDGARIAALGQPVARNGVAALGRIAEREQRFLAAGRLSGARDFQHLVHREIGRFEPRGRGRKSAVVAHVGAQARKRDEDLGRIGHARRAAGGADVARLAHQIVERRGEQAVDQGFVGQFWFHQSSGVRASCSTCRASLSRSAASRISVCVTVTHSPRSRKGSASALSASSITSASISPS